MRVDPENQAATQSPVEEQDWQREEKTVDLGGGSEEDTELVCFKRKKSLRARPLEQKSPTKEQAGKAHGRKRRRPEVVQKEDREPLVILAWKRWCMFEGEEGEDEIEALINKRDERRRLERQNELLQREQVRRNEGAGPHRMIAKDLHLELEISECSSLDVVAGSHHRTAASSMCLACLGSIDIELACI